MYAGSGPLKGASSVDISDLVRDCLPHADRSDPARIRARSLAGSHTGRI